MFNFRLTTPNKLRDAWIEINVDSIERNINELKKFIPSDKKILAVVKADSYGHGSVMLAQTLVACGIDMFGVSSIDEGLELRKAKIKTEILTLGAVPIWAFEDALKNNITVSIFNFEHIKAGKLLYEKTGKKLKVHVKIDTGMNRIGVNYKNAADFIKKVRNCGYFDLKGVFTHFACGENLKKNKVQAERFKDIINSIDTKDLIVHCANSCAAVSYPDLHFDMVRLGIVLYGLLPDFDRSIKKIPNLRPAMSLKGRITNIHTAYKGEGVSYGHKFVAKKDTLIATVPIGYADGISRNLSGKIYGFLNGKKVPQVGNVSMDQIMFDISGVKADLGDVIELIGENAMKIDDWAKILKTINYELTCRLKVRLPRVYTR